MPNVHTKPLEISPDLYRDWRVSRQSNMVKIVIGGEPHWFTPEQARDYAQSVLDDAESLCNSLDDQAEAMFDRIEAAANAAEES